MVAQEAAMPRNSKRHPSDRLPLLTDVATAHEHETAAEVLARLRERRCEFADVIHVLDRHERLHGAVALAALMAATPDARIASLREAVHASHEDADPERLASLALRHGVVCVPVVDHEGRLRGVVPPRGLMEITRSKRRRCRARAIACRGCWSDSRAACSRPC
jgi:magnesium transporter